MSDRVGRTTRFRLADVVLTRRNPAPVDFPVHEPLAERWSARAFDPQPVSPAILVRVFEAARWAPSSGNLQPWRFIVARQEDTEPFAALVSALNPPNQIWAGRAPVIGLAAADRVNRRNGAPNRWAWYDTGLAMALLSVQATVEGLIIHQMAGFDADRMRQVVGLPEDFDPVVAFVLGFPGDSALLDEFNARREHAPRVRRPQAESVFLGSFGHPFQP
ncbi:MAG: nitroreductase family protein [Vicinamibacterales bacterium]